jgi:hypothetical protein
MRRPFADQDGVWPNEVSCFSPLPFGSTVQMAPGEAGGAEQPGISPTKAIRPFLPGKAAEAALGQSASNAPTSKIIGIKVRLTALTPPRNPAASSALSHPPRIREKPQIQPLGHLHGCPPIRLRLSE